MTAQQIAVLPWNLWLRQLDAVVRLELKKSFFNKRAFWIYALALLPVIIFAVHSVIMIKKGRSDHTLGEDMMIFAGTFQFFYLKLGVFFGCVGVFSHLFRGEMLARTMHYYFLAPVRREVVALGKYLAGLTASATVFVLSIVLTYYWTGMHFGEEFTSYLRKEGLAHLGWYVLVTILACIGYGALFLLLGKLFRNPMIPAATVMVWEGINGFLPAILKKVSVIFYLKSLCPVNVPLRGVMALIATDADPAPAWAAIPGLLLVSAAVLAYASIHVRKLEISYSD